MQSITEKLKELQLVSEKCPEIVFVHNPALRTKSQEVDYMRGLVIGNHLIEVLKRYRTIYRYSTAWFCRIYVE